MKIGVYTVQKWSFFCFFDFGETFAATLQIWCSHSGVAEVAVLLGHDTVFLGNYFLMFCGIIVPSPEGSGSSRT